MKKLIPILTVIVMLSAFHSAPSAVLSVHNNAATMIAASKKESKAA